MEGKNEKQLKYFKKEMNIKENHIVNAEKIERTIKVKARPKNITVCAPITDIVIRYGRELTVRYFGYATGDCEPKIAIDVENPDTIKIKTDNSGSKILESTYLVITIPHKMEFLHIATVSGEIHVEDDICAEKVRCIGNSGSITCSPEAKEIEARTLCANLRIRSKATKINATTTTGNSYILPMNEEENIFIKANSSCGDIHICCGYNHRGFAVIDKKIKTSSGSIHVITDNVWPGGGAVFASGNSERGDIFYE